MQNNELLIEAKRRVIRHYAQRYAREFVRARHGVVLSASYSDAARFGSKNFALDDGGLDQLLSVISADDYLMALAATLGEHVHQFK